MSDIVERLRAGTAGLTLYEIEALWGEAATALSSMDAKPSVAAQNDVLYQLSRITENDIPLDMWEIRSIVKAAMQEMARLRRLERSTEAADAITTLRAENERLREALKPFAIVGQLFHDTAGATQWREAPLFYCGTKDNPQSHTLTGKAFDNARAALKERVQP